MIIGLVKQDRDPAKADLEDDDFKYAVKVADNTAADASVFWYRNVNGNYIETATEAQANQTVVIRVSVGDVVYSIYNNAGNLINDLGNIPFDMLNYTVAIGIRDIAANSSYTMPKVIYDQEFQVTDNGIERVQANKSIYSYVDEQENANLGAIPTPAPNPGNIYMYINFIKPAFGKTLGFYLGQLSYQGVETKFDGGTAIGELIFPQTIICELVSIPLTSYDGLIGSKRNILSIMQNMRLNNEKLLYHTENPIFLDLNTATDLNLRSLRVKFLNRSDTEEDDDLIDVKDRIELTLLIDSHLV
jgi:hypothetical protein